MTYDPGVKVTDTRNGDRGVIRSAHGQTRLVAWDDGGSEYVNVDYLTVNGKPAPPAPAVEPERQAVGELDDLLVGELEEDEPAAPPVSPSKQVWTRELIVERIQEWHRTHGRPPAQSDWDRGIARASGLVDRIRVFDEAAGHWPGAAVVKNRFGSWVKALAAAGFNPQRGRRAAPAEPKSEKETAPPHTEGETGREARRAA